MNRAHGVDVSKWQEPYKDDLVDEGFPLDFVIQKAADGTRDYTDPDSWEYEKWKAMRDSIDHFERVFFYHWFQTEQNPEAQAMTALQVLDADKAARARPYLKIVVDYENHLNEISQQSARDLKKYVEYVWDHTEAGVILYCNYWIYTLLLAWLPKEFMDKLDFWYAGGVYYNQVITEPIADSITPVLPSQAKGWVLWQYSADGNLAADELDFGDNEKSSIDLDVFNGTVAEMDAWLGLSKDAPPIDLGNGFAALDEAIETSIKWSEKAKQISGEIQSRD